MTDAIRPSLMDSDMGIHLPNLVIGLTAFLTVVDLFATQAILPTLVRHYHVMPSAMGVAAVGPLPSAGRKVMVPFSTG